MSDALDGREEGTATSAVGVDPAALAMGLAGADRDKANQFLEEQIALSKKQAHLVDLQSKELAHELKLRHWSLQLRHASAILKFALEVSAALIGVALVCFIAAVVWNASHADGLVVESFTVPPDLAARGLTGQTIAGQLMDKLSEMQDETKTVRAPRSYANDWDDNIKVEIPETGVSIGEVYNFLKSWLGHETHVNGDVWRTQNGIAITARTSDGGSNTVNGTEPELDGIIQKTAESIYNLTQPYRYAQYLSNQGRIQEAIVRYETLASRGETHERGWGYLGLINHLIDRGEATERERLLKEGQQYGNALLTGSLAGLESDLGRPELALSYEDKSEALLRSRADEFVPQAIPGLSKRVEAYKSALRGDYHAAVQDLLGAGSSSIGAGLIITSFTLAGYQAREHDVTGAGKTLKSSLGPGPAPAHGANMLAGLSARMQMAQQVGDWKTILADAEAMNPLFRQYPGAVSMKPTLYDPLIAVAEAKLGAFPDAERLISPTPADCYPCLMARGRIATIEGENARADWWYARAVSSNPSIPLAESEWGRVLLDRGQPDAAIDKFKLSNEKGTRFADPLEGWGEALIAKNRSDLALAKFAEAEKYAPNWGRLHLKWGEALVYAGEKDEARKQFATAARLDLTSSEKSELTRAGHV